MTGHIYSLQTYGITVTRFLSFLCLSVHTSPKYFIVSFSTSSFTSTYPFITSIVLPFQHIPCPQPSSPHHVIAFTLKKHMDLCFFYPTHTQRSSSYFHSIPLEPLTGRQPPLTINLTLAPTLPFAYFSFLVGSSCVHTVVLSHLCRNHSSTVSCHSPGFSPPKSFSTHFCHISFQA